MQFYNASETGMGWEACSRYVVSEDAPFEGQFVGPLSDLKTIKVLAAAHFLSSACGASARVLSVCAQHMGGEWTCSLSFYHCIPMPAVDCLHSCLAATTGIVSMLFNMSTMPF
jgi:hypothetical protein